MKQRSIKNKNVIVHNDRSDTIRLNKYISESGFCSRREADKLIESGLVTIDGIKASMGTKVSKGQKVKVNGKLISKEEDLVYIVLNKPVGITCTTEHKVKGNIVDFVNHKKRIFPIGRLDKDSPSISITSDGIIEMKNNKNKWGLELRLYVDTCPDEIKNTFGFNRNKHFRTEYNFRMNNNEVIYALFDHGFRIGLN